MSEPPDPISIYHITHVDNLPSIVRDGGLLCDAQMTARGGPAHEVGMNDIKQRRMRLPVACHEGDTVGEYVPFYFCPRSIMLYLLHKANHPDLTYRGGQRPLVHLQADLQNTVDWAQRTQTRWAFSLANAGAAYTPFRKDLSQLGEIDWDAVQATDFRAPAIKEGKQAEFLVKGVVPWSAIERIGVISEKVRGKALGALEEGDHRPPVDVMRGWYF